MSVRSAGPSAPRWISSLFIAGPVAAASLRALAQEPPAGSATPSKSFNEDGESVEPSPLEVQGDLFERLERAGVLANTIEKTETIDAKDLRRTPSTNLTDAIEQSAGIRVNNECSMCGIKRVMLNGLRGEHTPILVDGVPMPSVVRWSRVSMASTPSPRPASSASRWLAAPRPPSPRRRPSAGRSTL